MRFVSTETSLVHMPVMDWAKYHPICSEFLIHIANERKCSPAQGAYLKRMGVKAGVSDLFLAYPTASFAGFWIELKGPGKHPTATQQKWLDDMAALGYKSASYDNAELAINAIKEYLKEGKKT